MANHERSTDIDSWTPAPDFLCERDDLVTEVLKLVLMARVVAIRAPPQAGKTALLTLLGRRILHVKPALEPVKFDWQTRRSRKTRGLESEYSQYLTNERLRAQRENAEYRSFNPGARTIYLVDEAQGSYEEEEFWNQTLKAHDTRSQPLFVLVCVHGRINDEPAIESRASRLDTFQRVELRPSEPGQLSILFKQDETRTVARKWSMIHHYEMDDDVPGYLHAATVGTTRG